jgi:nucleotide-binding universal stress UspA family protein
MHATKPCLRYANEPRNRGGNVFKRILVPTDGSARAEHAARAAIELARHLNAAIVALYVYRPLKTLQTDPFTVLPIDIAERDYVKKQKENAKAILEVIDIAAREAGVKHTLKVVEDESPARAIVAAARSPEAPCDLVFIGSHGRGVIAQTILGSVTTKVQAMCSVPVLVYRDHADIARNVAPGNSTPPKRAAKTTRGASR